MIFATAWEVYKEITAVLGIVALVVAVWKRRPLLRFAEILLAAHWKAVKDIVRRVSDKWANSRGIKGKLSFLILTLFYTLALVVYVPKLIKLKIELLRKAMRLYRGYEYWSRVNNWWIR